MKKRVVAIGFFDGLHKGHKALTDMANSIAKEKNLIPTIFTFDKHPIEAITGEKIPYLINCEYRREELLQISHCEDVIFWEFNKDNASIEWDEFVVDVLINRYNVAHIVTGIDFRFGKEGRGNSKKLEEFCRELNIGFTAVPKILIDGERVSSSKIREFLSVGNIEKANEFLGHPYAISGEVIHGRAQGRLIGFKTANIKMPINMRSVPNGVYATKVMILGKIYDSVTNIGVIPTFLDQSEVIVETHIFDFDEEIYGEDIEVFLYKFMRPEMKFNGVLELKNQLKNDVLNTKNYFKEC